MSATAFATVTPPAVAFTLIVTAPALTPVTSPVADTVARDAFELDHVNVAAMAAPNWSRAAAVS